MGRSLPGVRPPARRRQRRHRPHRAAPSALSAAGPPAAAWQFCQAAAGPACTGSPATAGSVRWRGPATALGRW